jgi:hypothetical protein
VRDWFANSEFRTRLVSCPQRFLRSAQSNLAKYAQCGVPHNEQIPIRAGRGVRIDSLTFVATCTITQKETLGIISPGVGRRVGLYPNATLRKAYAERTIQPGVSTLRPFPLHLYVRSERGSPLVSNRRHTQSSLSGLLLFESANSATARFGMARFCRAGALDQPVTHGAQVHTLIIAFTRSLKQPSLPNWRMTA